MSEIVANITRVSTRVDPPKRRAALTIAVCCLSCAGAPAASSSSVVTRRAVAVPEAPSPPPSSDGGTALRVDGAVPSTTVSQPSATHNVVESAAPNADPSRVRVTNIGLHVGGGPNDRATKAPFLRAIAEHFDTFRTCYMTTDAAGQRGTFGIDLLVPAAGGHADASNARTRLGGSAFRECVVDAFRDVNFAPPKLGATKISYALEFDPK
jgi:hypothetical protein